MGDALTGHFSDGVDIVLDYLSGRPAETLLAAIGSSNKPAKPIRYVIAGGSAGPSTRVPNSVLGSTSLLMMGSGIGAVPLQDIVASSTKALDIAASADLHMDVTELPLGEVEQAWGADHGRSRVVFTV